MQAWAASHLALLNLRLCGTSVGSTGQNWGAVPGRRRPSGLLAFSSLPRVPRSLAPSFFQRTSLLMKLPVKKVKVQPFRCHLIMCIIGELHS